MSDDVALGYSGSTGPEPFRGKARTFPSGPEGPSGSKDGSEDNAGAPVLAKKLRRGKPGGKRKMFTPRPDGLFARENVGIVKGPVSSGQAGGTEIQKN